MDMSLGRGNLGCRHKDHQLKMKAEIVGCFHTQEMPKIISNHVELKGDLEPLLHNSFPESQFCPYHGLGFLILRTVTE